MIFLPFFFFFFSFPELFSRSDNCLHHTKGRTENALLDFAQRAAPNAQATIAKPGAIKASGPKATPDAVIKALFQIFGHTPHVHVSELAAAMIDQCQHGVTEDPLWSDKLFEIGKRVLREEDYQR